MYTYTVYINDYVYVCIYVYIYTIMYIYIYMDITVSEYIQMIMYIYIYIYTYGYYLSKAIVNQPFFSNKWVGCLSTDPMRGMLSSPERLVVVDKTHESMLHVENC